MDVVDYWINTLALLFETHQVMQVIALIFIINVSITGFEIFLDLLTKKVRRWKDTAANCVIYIAHQIIEKTAFGALGFIALLPVFFPDASAPSYDNMELGSCIVSGRSYLLLDAPNRA